MSLAASYLRVTNFLLENTWLITPVVPCTAYRNTYRPGVKYDSFCCGVTHPKLKLNMPD